MGKVTVYLCEKPDVAFKLARSLDFCSGAKKHEFHLECQNGVIITWLHGNLLSLFMPGDYDPAYKAWRLEHLPIVPERWQLKVKPKHKKHFNYLKKLLARADEVVIATDFDREGEGIARSALEYAGYHRKISRLKIQALDTRSLQKAVHHPLPGNSTYPLYLAALARWRADWLYGINLSRFFTLATADTHEDSSFNVGRVQTPTIALVCNRDREIALFEPHDFYTLTAEFSVMDDQGSNPILFRATWVPPEDVADENNRCIIKTAAQKAQLRVLDHTYSIIDAKIKLHNKTAPLPFDLTSLQRYANRKWKYTAKQTHDAAQSLYARHGLIYYPRTDCRHLPTNLLEDAEDIFRSIAQNLPHLNRVIQHADPSLSGRAYNDIRIRDCAHHGIIPTTAKTDFTRLTEIEKRIYEAISRYYLAQHLAEHVFKSYEFTVDCAGELFKARFKEVIHPGWMQSISDDVTTDSEQQSPNEVSQNTEAAHRLAAGLTGFLSSCAISDRKTSPLSHYTEDTLLSAMENIHRFVENQEMRRILKTARGLGTPATRAEIINQAVENGYLKRDGNLLLATSKAYLLMAILPKQLASPLITARWEMKLEEISRGQARISDFLKEIENFVTNIVNNGKKVLRT